MEAHALPDDNTPRFHKKETALAEHDRGRARLVIEHMLDMMDP